jgi:hypothetical protein
MSVASFKYRDQSGNVKEGQVSLDDYRAAMSRNMRTSAYINAKYQDADPRFGNAWEQALKYNGIFTKEDPQYGILPTTVGEIMSGDCVNKMQGFQMAGFQLAGGTIASVNGPIGGSTPATRIFFPEVVLAIMDQYLRGDYTQEMNEWNKMFAVTETIPSEVFTIPKIDTTAPAAQDSRPITENSLPTNMVSITSSQVSYAMNSWSIGLQISEKAQRDVSIPLVSIILQEQADGEMKRHLWRSLNRIVTGNPDAGESALTPVSFKNDGYDSGAAANTITNSGWLSVLSDPDRIHEYDYILGDFDAYLAIMNRSGRPLAYDPTVPANGINTGNAGSYGLDAGTPRLINFGTMNPAFMRTPTGVITNKSMLLMDSRRALRRVISSQAAYSAIENMVLQRVSVMRFDGASFIHRMREESLLWLDFSNPTL